MDKAYQDNKVVSAIRESMPSMFGEQIMENNIENLHITINGDIIEFEERKLVNDMITVIIPSEFKKMDDEMADLKYLSNDRPEHIYSNEDTTFGMTFSIDDEAEIDSLGDLRDTIKDYMLKLHPNYKLITSNTTPKKDIFYFSIITDALDDRIYNVIYLIKLNKGILMGTINRSEEDYDLWEDIFLQIIDSIIEV